MKNLYIYKFFSLYILLLQIKSIKNFIYSFTEEDEIISIHPISDTEFYYFTKTELKQISNNGNPVTKATGFKFTEYTDIIMKDKTQLIFISTCTEDNLIEIFDSTGTLLSNKPYPKSNSVIDCPIHFYNNKVYYPYISELDGNIYTLKCYEDLIDSSTNVISSSEESSFSLNYNTSTKNKLSKYMLNCFPYKGEIQNLHKRGIPSSSSSPSYLNYQKTFEDSINNTNISGNFFNVIFKDDNELIFYTYDSSSYLFIYIMNETFSQKFLVYEYSSISDIKVYYLKDEQNIKIFQIFYFFENGTIDFSTYREFYDEKTTYNKYEMKLENTYSFKNEIGCSKFFMEPIKNSNSDFFMIIRGNSNNLNKYEYYSLSHYDNFLKTKFYDCTEEKKFNYYEKEQENFIFTVQEILIKPLDLDGVDDEIIFNYNYKYKSNEKVQLYITLSTMTNIINVTYSSITTKITGYILIYSKNPSICNFLLYTCNLACKKCSSVEVAEGSPTKCRPKMCNDDYYYTIEDETECLLRPNECYNTCNTCTTKGNNYQHQCETCKYEHTLMEPYNNCMICDPNRNYFYYNLSKSNECSYGYNKCPSNYPIYLSTGQCVDYCPEGYYFKNSTCIEKFYFYNENREKKFLEYSCNATNRYFTFNTKECVNDCTGYLQFEDSQICIPINKCSEPYYFKPDDNNQFCICKNGVIEIYDYNNITCITIDDVLQQIEDSSDLTIEQQIKLIEKSLKLLRNYYQPIFNFNDDTKIQIVNSTDINDENSNSRLGSIDLKQCENILISNYNLDPSIPLLVVLISTPSKTNSIINNLNFNIYTQSGQKLDLNLCSNEKILVYNPIPDDAIINLDLIRRLQNEGINLFDINSDFYHDKCFGYDYENNDITTEDRIKDIYPQVSICDPGCHFEDYNPYTRRVACSCYVKTEFKENIPKNETKNFFKSINNQINYHLLSCVRVFNLFRKQFYKNVGFYLWCVCFLGLFVGLQIYLITFKDKFYEEVNKFNKNDEEKKEIKGNPPVKRKITFGKPIELTKSTKTKLDMQSEIELDPKGPKNVILDYNDKSKNININKKRLRNINSSKSGLTLLDSKEQNIDSSSKIEKNLESTVTERNLVSQVNNPLAINKLRQATIIGKINYNQKNGKTLIDRLYEKYYKLFNKQERDNYWVMTYGNALEYDKRLFYQSYLSFLFIKSDLISTIFYPETFSYYPITIPFYFFSLLIDFTLNAILYSDDIVHQKYANKGKLYFVTQFILSLISNFIGFIIVKYCRKLIEVSFAFETLRYEIKVEEDFKEYSKKLISSANHRIVLGVFLQIIICTFCGFYIYIFCEVYRKSQVSLFLNFLVGLAISVATIIIIGIIVCILRTIALKCKYKKMYYSSKYISELI